jgi:hypothetical protein
MKRNFLTIVVVSLFTAIAFNSCENDNENNDSNGMIVTVTVENGSGLNGKIDVVKAMIYYDKGDGNWGSHVIASAPLQQ